MSQLCRQVDHTAKKSMERLKVYCEVMFLVAKRRKKANHVRHAITNILLTFADNYAHEVKEQERYKMYRDLISSRGFFELFQNITDRAFLQMFRFTRRQFGKISEVLGLLDRSHTEMNRYAVDGIISTAIVLRRLSSPARCVDLERFFYRHSSHLCEIFWETIELFWIKYGCLITNLPQQYLRSRCTEFSESIYRCSSALKNCVAFIDGTVIAMARTGTDAMQRDTYNGHKRQHALKYQAITTPDGMMLNLAGPVVGRRHDWFLYMNSGLEEILPVVLNIEGERFCIWGDPGYNNRWFLETPFQGANLSLAQKAFNTAISTVRITVEWAFEQVKLYWTSVDFKRKLKVREIPISLLYQTGVLLSNFHNCFHPNQTSIYFSCPPISFEEYISLVDHHHD